MRKSLLGVGAIAALLSAWSRAPAQAGDLAIQSFDGTGRLSFSSIPTATVYRVEWAPSPAGPWSCFADAAADLDEIAPFSGSHTNHVPMCYRVVASVTNTTPGTADYLVIDLSGGADAASYPVSELPAPPPRGWPDEYRTSKLLLRRIPAGSFQMGSPSDEVGRWFAEDLHQVTLTKDFYIGVFEVTQVQWELVMGGRPSGFENVLYYATRPVECVSYYDIREIPGDGLTGGADDPAVDWPINSDVNADSFMGRLRTKTGLAALDLPTEAQWEYACRAGTSTALNSGFDLTNTLQDAHMHAVGRYAHNGGTNAVHSWCAPVSATAKVGSYRPNAWGLYDMHGNVVEWCLDWYTAPLEDATDPAGALEDTGTRSARGGCWGVDAWQCRSACRGERASPEGFWDTVGFRVAMTVTPPN